MVIYISTICGIKLWNLEILSEMSEILGKNRGKIGIKSGNSDFFVIVLITLRIETSAVINFRFIKLIKLVSLLRAELIATKILSKFNLFSEESASAMYFLDK